MSAKIKHVVISSGGPLLLNMYGAMKQSNLSKMWSHETVESYYGTSAGAVLSTMMALKYDWDELDNYLINRPWHTILNFNVLNIYDYYLNNGITDENFIYSMFTPLLKAKDIDVNVNMETFRKITGVTLYMYTTEFSTLNVKEFSADATPHAKLLDVIYASMAVPVLFKPMKIDGELYFDGCIFLHYPLSKCIEKNKDCETILGITYKGDKPNETKVEDFNMFGYMANILSRLISKIQLDATHDYSQNKIIEIEMNAEYADNSNFFKLANTSEGRKEAIEQGCADALIVSNRLNKTD